jgi:hypothetical protein
MTPLERIERHAIATETTADEAWWTWVRAAVRRGVRCDVSAETLRELPRVGRRRERGER